MVTKRKQFGPLRPSDEFSTGVFFMVYEDEAGEFHTDGVATLLSLDGILVTCAHVVMSIGKVPGTGDSVALYYEPEAIFVDAEVLEEGWSGPEPDNPNNLARWSHLTEFELSELKEDVAFLRIRTETARPSDLAGDTPVQSKLGQRLLSRAKVLPLGRPSRYATSPLESHCLTWDGPDTPVTIRKASSFSHEGLEMAQIQVESGNMAHGDSGSPLWDEDRRVVCGFARRYPVEFPDTIFAADPVYIAQALRKMIPGYSIQWDAVAANFRSRFSDHVQRYSALQNSAITQKFERMPFIEPSLRPLHLHPEIAQVEDASAEPASQVLGLICASGMTAMVLGQAGSGKSTLCFRYAESLLEAHKSLAAGRLANLPLVIPANEIDLVEGDLAARLDSVARKMGLLKSDRVSVRSMAELNDSPWVVFIDGLDELEGDRRRRFLRFLAAQLSPKPRWLRSLVLTSRQLDRLGKRTFERFAPFELLAFSPTQKEEFIAAWFGDDKEKFKESLRPHQLYLGTGNPLLMTMAAALYEDGKALPERPSDLYSSFVELQFERSEKLWFDSTIDRVSPDRRFDLKLYDACQEITKRAAFLTIHDRSDLTCLEIASQLIEDGSAATDKGWRSVGKGTLSRFIASVLAKDCGLFSLNENQSLAWVHAVIRDVCASEAVIEYYPAEAADAELEGWRDENRQEFLCALASMMLDDGRQQPVARAIQSSVRRSRTHPRAIMFPVQLIATGAKLDDETSDNVISNFAMLLLQGKLELRCVDLFTTDNDLLGAWDLARLDVMRDLIANKLVSRMMPRDGRRIRRTFRREIDTLEKIGAVERLSEIASGALGLDEAASQYAKTKVKASSPTAPKRFVDAEHPIGKWVPVDLFMYEIDPRDGHSEHKENAGQSRSMDVSDLAQLVAAHLVRQRRQ